MGTSRVALAEGIVRVRNSAKQGPDQIQTLRRFGYVASVCSLQYSGLESAQCDTDSLRFGKGFGDTSLAFRARCHTAAR